MASIKHIQRNSAELRRLNERIHETVKTRWNSPEQQADWEQACAEFHQRFDNLFFPGGSEMLSRVRANDPEALDAAVAFLAADPYHFRSGYIKDYLWRWLQHCELTASHRLTLERTALHYLGRRITREFWSMCKAMSRLGGGDFWARVSAQANPSGTPESFRAFCLLTYGANIHAGAQLRRSVLRSWLQHTCGRG